MTSIPIRPYNLPDMEFFHSCDDTSDAFAFVPDQRYVVLGRGSVLAGAFRPETVQADHVPVMQRPSGGETVLLSPNTLVIAAVRNGVPLQDPHGFFRAFSAAIIAGLTEAGVRNLSRRGISDICIGQRKILGSSIYWRRKKLLYHAVLNVGEDPETIERYLLHPPREPGYRNGRSHTDFVTSLRHEGVTAPMDMLRGLLVTALKEDHPFSGANTMPSHPL